MCRILIPRLALFILFLILLSACDGSTADSTSGPRKDTQQFHNNSRADSKLGDTDSTNSTPQNEQQTSISISGKLPTPTIDVENLDFNKVQAAVDARRRFEMADIGDIKPPVDEIERLQASLNDQERLYAGKLWKLLTIRRHIADGTATEEERQLLPTLKADVYSIAAASENAKSIHDFQLEGTVRDESGEFLKDVSLTIVVTPMSNLEWEPHKQNTKRMVNKSFNIEVTNADGVELRFFKPGYNIERLFFSPSASPEFIDPNQRRIIARNIQVTLHAIRVTGTIKRRIEFRFTADQPTQSINMKSFAADIAKPSDVKLTDTLRFNVPFSNHLLDTAQYSHGSSKPQIFPKSMTIEISGQKSGLVLFMPNSSAPTWHQMREAPDKGYISQVIKLDKDDFISHLDRQRSGSSYGSGLVHFYIRSGNMYGRCVIHGLEVNTDRTAMRLWGRIDFQPNGSTVLGE